MKNLILLLLLTPLVSFGQYSSYYGTVDVNANVNVNKNVNVSGDVNVNKTITTIDYGALKLANAQREKNRLERLKYSDSKNQREAIEIANNPIKAYDYGEVNNWTTRKIVNPGAQIPIYKNDKIAKSWGFKYFNMSFTVPHNSLFNKISLEGGGGYSYQNISENFINTAIEIYGSTASSLVDMGQLLNAKQIRWGSRLTFKF